jgi:hypothetical protein
MELVGSVGVFDNLKQVWKEEEGSGGWSDDYRLGSCCDGAGGGGGIPGPLVDSSIVPDGVVMVMTSDDCTSEPTSMRYPTGRDVLNPWIGEGYP